jgi:hypothetical protein
MQNHDPSPSVWISNDVFDDNLSYGTKTEVGRTYRHGKLKQDART